LVVGGGILEFAVLGSVGGCTEGVGAGVDVVVAAFLQVSDCARGNVVTMSALVGAGRGRIFVQWLALGFIGTS
jgi:hypothetical protein